MTERISTLNSLTSSVNLLQRLQSSIDLTGRQISSGRRVLTPADDPIAAARAIEIRESLARVQQFDRNSAIVTSRLQQEETALTLAGDVLQRIRELAVQANNATQSNESRNLIAIEMRSQLDALVRLANQKDGNGAYLFAGTKESVQPVIQSGAVFTYNGDDGRRLIQIGEGRSVSDGDPGSEIFFRIRNGNGDFLVSAAGSNTGAGIVGSGSLVDPTQYDRDTYTINFTTPTSYEVRDSSAGLVVAATFEAGDTIAFRGIEFSIDGVPDAGDSFVAEPSRNQDVFSMVSDLISATETRTFGDQGQAEKTNGINAGLRNLDQAIGSILNTRTQAGARLSVIEAQQNANDANAISFQETLARIEDLDYAEALSRLSAETLTLEAAQKSFLRIQGLSLFNFL